MMSSDAHRPTNVGWRRRWLLLYRSCIPWLKAEDAAESGMTSMIEEPGAAGADDAGVAEARMSAPLAVGTSCWTIITTEEIMEAVFSELGECIAAFLPLRDLLPVGKVNRTFRAACRARIAALPAVRRCSECFGSEFLTVMGRASDPHWSWSTGGGRLREWWNPPTFTGFGGTSEDTEWEHCVECGRMTDFDPDKCAAIEEEWKRYLEQWDVEEDETPEYRGWCGPEVCGFCGAAPAKMMHAHCRRAGGGMELRWQIADGQVHEGNPPSGGHEQDEDADWFSCLVCGRLDGFDVARATEAALLAVGEPQGGDTALIHAVRHGRTADVRALLIGGALVDEPKTNGSGATPLYVASLKGHFEIVMVLLAAGADVNRFDTEWRERAPPLYVACQNDHIDVTSALLAANADVNKPDAEGTTPLAIARNYTSFRRCY